MKKLIAVVVLLCIAFTGCSGQSAGSTPNGGKPSENNNSKSDYLICIDNNSEMKISDDFEQQLKDNNIKAEYSIFEDDLGGKSRRFFFFLTNAGDSAVELKLTYEYLPTADSDKPIDIKTQTISSLMPGETGAITDISTDSGSELDAKVLGVKLETSPANQVFVSVFNDITVKTSIIEKEKSIGTETFGVIDFEYNGKSTAYVNQMTLVYYNNNIPVNFSTIQFPDYKNNLEPGYKATIEDDVSGEVDSCKLFINTHYTKVE